MAQLVPVEPIERELALADTPAKVFTLDGKLAVVLELFKKEKRALAEQNQNALLRIRTQRRGGQLLAETVRRGRPKKSSHDESFSLPDGIDHNVSHRWQAMAAIAEKFLDDYVKAQTTDGSEVTCAGFVRYAEAARDGVHFSSDSEEWFTPREIVDRVLQVFGAIDLDPCSNSKTTPNVPAKKHFTKFEDGLSRPWRGKVYMNPPYGRELAAWVEKLVGEHEARRASEAIALVPSRTDTEWFRRLKPYPRCFLFGRLHFSGHGNPAPFPSMAVYLGSRVPQFAAAFADVGDIYQLRQ